MCSALLYSNECKAPRISHADNESTRALVAELSVLRERYKPSLCCLSRHTAVLTVWWHDQKVKLGLTSHVAFDRQEMVHADGGVTALDWLRTTAPADPLNPSAEHLADDAPIVIFLHSICADLDDDYGLAGWLRAAQRGGWRPVVHARRGHGGLALRTPRFSALGDPADFADALETVHARYPNAPLVAVAVSAGTGPLLTFVGRSEKLLAERVEKSTAPTLRAAVAVSAGYHVPIAFDRCTAFYQPIMLAKIKGMYVRSRTEGAAAGGGATTRLAAGTAQRGMLAALVARARSDDDLELLARHDAAALARLVSAPTMKEFHFAAQPFAGYAAGSDNPLRDVQRSRTPLLCISADDDPLCVAANVADAKRGGLLSASTMTILAETKKGSHLGFYEGWGARRRWAERAAFEFLAKALDAHPSPASGSS